MEFLYGVAVTLMLEGVALLMAAEWVRKKKDLQS